MYNLINDEEDFISEGPLSLGIEAVYYSKDIEKTLRWFDSALGWLTKVQDRDAADEVIRGVAYTIPWQYYHDGAQKSVKIHILPGEPRQGVVSIIATTKLDKLVSFVNRRNRKATCTITQDEVGTRYAEITTVDGSILTFYQSS